MSFLQRVPRWSSATTAFSKSSRFSSNPLDLLSNARPTFSASTARVWIVLFFSTAAMTGILAQFILFNSGFSLVRSAPPPQTMIPKPGIYEEQYVEQCSASGVSEKYIRNGLGQVIFPEEDSWTWDRVKSMVQGTRGFLARDWPLTLGWNNLRYIIEAGLLEAKMTNRTLVLPSYVYARSCQFEQDACAIFATQVQRGDDIGMGDFGYLSKDQQQAWRIPMSIMIDIPHLREHSGTAVVTAAEYLRYNGLPINLERPNGHWDLEKYHMPPQLDDVTLAPLRDGDERKSRGGPSHYIFNQDAYEPSGVVRVDRAAYESLRSHTFEKKPIYKAIAELLGDNKAVDLEDVKLVLKERNLAEWESELELELLLHDFGWTVVHTFKGVWMEMLKTVHEPIAQVALTSQLRGFLDEYGGVESDVLFVAGEIHSNMKPGSLRFAKAKDRTDFAALVLKGVRPIKPIQELGERLARRMMKLNDGRMFMSAHMRRGDFVEFSWAPDKSIEGHLARVQLRLEQGRRILEKNWQTQARPKTVDVEGIHPDTFFENAMPPRKDDKIFVATDEHHPEALAYLRSQNVVLISDLLTPEDRRLVGWPLLVTDVLALVEQQVASHGAYFWGHGMSSVAGGIINARAARGLDPRTSVIDCGLGGC